MKNKQFYECLKCGGKTFKLQFRTYEEMDEDFHGEYLTLICATCERQSFAMAVSQKLFKHVEKEFIKEELGIATDEIIDLDE